MVFSGEREPTNPSFHLGIRPYCPCCAGGERRKGKRYTKAKSHNVSLRAKRNKNKKPWRRRNNHG